MPKIEMYSWSTCPYCARAKRLLDMKKVDYTDYDITGDEAARDEMARRTGGARSVPQIFIDDKHVGGCDDLFKLDLTDDLDKLLGKK